MNTKKYILTNETMNYEGHTLHRIQAVRSFGDVQVGDLGGWIESEENLSHVGNCWVYEDAHVFGEARVYDKAQVFGEARVYGDAHVFEDARIYGTAQVFEDAWVYDKAKVFGEAKVFGTARVFGEARVYGDAQVFEDAWVYDKAQVFGEARVYGEVSIDICTSIEIDADIKSQYDYLVIPNIGSRRDTTTFFKKRDGKIAVRCGCFSGTIEEFEKAVEKTHGDNEHGRAYRIAITAAREMLVDLDSENYATQCKRHLERKKHHD